MKKRLVILLLAVFSITRAFGEVTASIGGGAAVDGAIQVAPTLDFAVLGDHSFVPTDRIGLYFDWSAGGSSDLSTASLNGLLALTGDVSYISDKILARLSVSSVANPSTVDDFYGAASADLLLSYGGPERSLFVVPRLSVVENAGTTFEASAEVGAALLLFDSLLLKPIIDAGTAVPGGPSTSWRIGPSATLDWYPAGPFTASLQLGFARSHSVLESTLVVGGRLLPLDSWDRYSASAGVTWYFNRGLSLSGVIPCDYYRKSYVAYEGAVDLGVPAWLVELSPTVDFTIPLSTEVDLVISGKGSFGLSNNSDERTTSASAMVHFELHLD
ncbi:MAG TPA: hypothetical protein VMW69_11005 [Spirochaetia bacterium]|nr:hypothetical protein [Spirochaetia bacterium]